MTFDPLSATAGEIVVAIRDGRTSSEEVVSVHLARIAVVNPALNAVVQLDPAALANARAADAAMRTGKPAGRLHGLPFTVKDVLDVAGLPHVAGDPQRATLVPERNATVVARMQAALHEALGSAEAALASATTVNGRHIAPGEIGIIAAGARADLLLTTQDPTEQLAALADWRVVFADGRAYDRPTVDAWLEDYRLHFRGGLYRAVVGTAVSLVVDQFGHTSKGTDGSRAVAARSRVGALASAP